MLMDGTCKAKQKSLGKEWRIFNTTTRCSPQNNTAHSKRRLTGGQKRREPQWAIWTQCQRFWFRSWNPAEQLAAFQHLGHETAADGKPESELKVKPEEGGIFKKGKYNCIIQGENIIMPQRQEVLFELVLKEHRSSKCASWLGFLQLNLKSGFIVLSLGDIKENLRNVKKHYKRKS